MDTIRRIAAALDVVRDRDRREIDNVTLRDGGIDIRLHDPDEQPVVLEGLRRTGFRAQAGQSGEIRLPANNLTLASDTKAFVGWHPHLHNPWMQSSMIHRTNLRVDIFRFIRLDGSPPDPNYCWRVWEVNHRPLTDDEIALVIVDAEDLLTGGRSDSEGHARADALLGATLARPQATKHLVASVERASSPDR